jgi:DNA-directed RNA polymerase subunit RPC12/RpoP
MAKSGRKKPRYLVKGQANSEERSRALGVRMPDGRIAADTTKQNQTSAFTQKLFYEDQEYVCRDCGKSKVWTAEAQKWWFEVAKGPIQSRAIRCRECRVALREAHQGTPRRSQPDRLKADGADS